MQELAVIRCLKGHELMSEGTGIGDDLREEELGMISERAFKGA